MVSMDYSGSDTTSGTTTDEIDSTTDSTTDYTYTDTSPVNYSDYDTSTSYEDNTGDTSPTNYSDYEDQSKTIRVVGGGSSASWSLDVTGALSGGTKLENNDSFSSGSSGSGMVAGGTDSVTFTGSISDLDVPSHATVYVDGIEKPASEYDTTEVIGSTASPGETALVTDDPGGVPSTTVKEPTTEDIVTGGTPTTPDGENLGTAGDGPASETNNPAETAGNVADAAADAAEDAADAAADAANQAIPDIPDIPDIPIPTIKVDASGLGRGILLAAAVASAAYYAEGQ